MRLCVLLCLLLAVPAGALTIQIDSVSKGPGNTANSANNASAVGIGTQSDSVPDVAGGPFAETDAYWQGTVYSDDPFTAAATADWEITFSVIANPGVVYDVVIFQELLGAFSFLDDSAGDGSGSVGELTGTLGGVANPLLTMPVGVDGSASSSATASIPFQRSRILELDNLTGSQSFTLTFTFDLSATSSDDQAAVQLGLQGGITAAGYPGIGLRDAASDGHRLSLSTRVIAAVPEPGTLPLIAFGLLALARRHRCR